MPTKLLIPTEYEEQVAVVQYCDLNGYFYWHTPNETYTKSWNQKRRNTALGTTAGIPDLFVIIDGQLIAIEMKRQKGGAISNAQREWIERLNDAGGPAKVCCGFDEAKNFIDMWIQPKSKNLMEVADV